MAKNDLTGHTLGQYTITARLGRGGMADVYKAYHPKLEVYRAVKVIRPEFVTASDFRERFQKEAQSVASLRHSNIVQIHDFGEQDDAYFMVMEFIEGQDLKRIIKSEGKIRPIRRPLELINQVADALHYAHSRGLIHRDIKPENIMINEDGLPILMDFGIAKLLTANTQLTQTGMGIGTPAYMAPEQAQALPEIGPTADIYSLSVVLYEMLTGQVPFSADTPMAVMLKAINDPAPMPRQFSADISENLQQVLLKGMAKDPENRYTTARQFQKALQEVIDQTPESSGEPAATALMQSGEREQPGDSESPESRQRTRASDKATKLREERHGSGRPGLVAALVVLALVLVGGAGAGAYFLLQPDRSELLADAPDTGEGAESEVKTALEDAQPLADEPGAQGERAEPGPADGRQEAEGQPIADEQRKAEEQPEADAPAAGGGTALADTESEAEAGDSAPGPADDAGNAGAAAEPEVEPPSEDGPRVAAAETGEAAEASGHPGVTEPPSREVPRESPEPSAVDGGMLRLGNFVRDEFPVPGRAVAYEFEAEAGQSVFFDHVDNQRSARRVDFRLMAPDGRTPVFETQGDQGPVTLEVSGTYTLVADPRDERVAGYEFVVWSVDPVEVDGGMVQFDSQVQGQTSVPGQAVIYRFQANPGEAIRFEHVESTEPTEFTLTAPDGTRVFRTQGDFGPHTLEQGGTYTLLASPREDWVSKFKFVVRRGGAS